MRTNRTKNQLGLAPMRIPKTRASWIELPPPNTRSWSQVAQVPGDLRPDACGVVLHDEVPRVVEHDDLRVRDLLAEAVGAGHRRVVVLGAPQDQRGHAELREAALVGRELGEVSRPVEREPGLALLERRKALPVL